MTNYLKISKINNLNIKNGVNEINKNGSVNRTNEINEVNVKKNKSVKLFRLLNLLTFLILISCSEKGPAKNNYWKEGQSKPIKKIQNEKGQHQFSFLQKLNKEFSDLASRLSPSVVNIYTKTKIEFKKNPGFMGPTPDIFDFFFGNPFGGGGNNGWMPFPQEQSSLGSGFIINAKEGYIITNSHVVRPNKQKASEIMVKFINQNKGKGFEAKIIGIDESVDVALLKLKEKKKKLEPAILGDSDKIKVAEWVLAIGNPYGHAHTVTEGIISALGRESDINRAEFIQTSASINPGNSGGPLFNMNGEVIGINTAIDARAQGIGFAIPINTAKYVIKQLIETGEVKRGWLGIGIADINPEIVKELNLPIKQGVLVQSVENDEPADKAGLKVYDVIHKLDNKIMYSARKLSNTVAVKKPGSKINLEIYRNGKKKIINATLGKRPNEGEIIQGQNEDHQEKSNEITKKTGLVLAPITKNVRRQLNLDKDIQGALVSQVFPYSKASEANISPGDIIIEINRKSVKNPVEAEKQIIKALNKKKNLLLRLQKTNGLNAVVVLELKE